MKTLFHLLRLTLYDYGGPCSWIGSYPIPHLVLTRFLASMARPRVLSFRLRYLPSYSPSIYFFLATDWSPDLLSHTAVNGCQFLYSILKSWAGECWGGGGGMHCLHQPQMRHYPLLCRGNPILGPHCTTHNTAIMHKTKTTVRKTSVLEP